MKHPAALSALVLCLVGAIAADPPTKALPLPGEVFALGGRTAFLIPATADPHAKAKPWVWYAPTLPNLPGPEEAWMFERFRAAGIAVAGIDAGESYGSPAGNAAFDTLHEEMTRRGYSAKPVLLGRSRGGLQTLSWAAAHPDKVGGFAGIYPVCDLASYPGVAKAAGAYGLKAEELDKRLKEFNPVDRLEGLAKAKVPLFAVHGDVDKVVPLEANSGRVKGRYKELGGTMTLIVPPGQGHNMWPGFFRCRELVEFVLDHAGVGLWLDSPRPYQVVQRGAKNVGTVRVQGRLGEPAKAADGLEYRIGSESHPGEWRKLDATFKGVGFDATVDVPAGGWYTLGVRATVKGMPVAEAKVERVGVGEVFVVAGQSNAANHGAEKQATRTKRVSAFDGTDWQLADDPQPGASGTGGSFLPPFGDAMAEKFGVPVGLVACGVGATSVREWLPKGASFPNPPTIETNVKKSGDAWESKGDIYAAFRDRMKALGPNGFRAVLWHQGESDANQKDAARTLLGKLYREYLAKLIRESRKDLGREVPWFVARASYHGPDDTGSADIRDAQAALWKDGIALEGPDTDSLKGAWRDGGGKGVHFSGPGLRAHAAKWAEKVAPWLEKHPAVTRIGFTGFRTDLPGGRHANVRTMRAAVVRADGTGRTPVGEGLASAADTWTQLAGWSPDGKTAVVGVGWQSPENAEWEDENKRFRMDEGRWKYDTCLLDPVTGKTTNVTAVGRVSHYNSGLFFLPGGKGLGFTALIKGVSKPHVMDLDGKNKRDVSGGGGFAYGYSASPDGKHISYHANYQLYVSAADGSGKRHIKTGNTFDFAPAWSPDGRWLLFLSGAHYDCHPHVVRPDGTGLKKLADRGGYKGVVEFLDVPDFHGGSSDVPVWSPDGSAVYYTAKVGKCVELFRVTLDGTATRLTKSADDSLHYHPQPSPDGNWLVYGSKRGGVRNLYVMNLTDRSERRVTDQKAGTAAMWPHWQPAAAE
jgi:TolB protein